MPSGSTTFPLASGGLWTPPPGVLGIKWLDIQHAKEMPTEDVTGVCVVYDAEEEEYVATNDTDRQFIQAATQQEFVGQGVVQANGCSTYGYATALVYTIAGGLTAKLVQWNVRKYWPLQPVSDGAEEEYVAGRPIIQVSANGWATGASGPGMSTTALSTLTLQINGFGTLALKAGASGVLGQLTQGAPLRDGGAIPVSFGAIISGGATYTGSNFSWLFATPDLPIKGDAELTTGETVTHSVLGYDITFSNPTTRGGAVPVVMRMRFDKE